MTTNPTKNPSKVFWVMRFLVVYGPWIAKLACSVIFLIGAAACITIGTDLIDYDTMSDNERGLFMIMAGLLILVLWKILKW